MADEIRPALTVEEWRRHWFERQGSVNRTQVHFGGDRAGDGFFALTPDGPTGSAVVVNSASLHAVAAVALHGQPFGFTHADVDLLLNAAVAIEARMDKWNLIETEKPPRLRELADRIAALLPPREP